MSARALHPTANHLEDIAGLVLAGGKSSRFGGKAKAFQSLAGEPLIAHALRPLRALHRIAISANDERERYEVYSNAVISDLVADCGPLGGIHAGLTWAASLKPRAQWLATVPIDMPFLPDDFIDRLAAARDGVVVVVAATQEDFSPVCALWHADQLPALTAALGRGVRKMTDYLGLASWRKATLEAEPIDPLFNINTPESLPEAEALLLHVAKRAP